MIVHDLLPRTVEGALTVLGGGLGLIWSAALQSVAPLVWWFAVMVAADLATGIWAGIKSTGFSSKQLSRGLIKKGIAFFIITLAHGLDVSFWYILKALPIFQSVTLCAYICGEFGSIVKNVEHAGYGNALPPVLRKLFLSLEERLEHAVDSKLDAIGLDDKDEKNKDEK